MFNPRMQLKNALTLPSRLADKLRGALLRRHYQQTMLHRVEKYIHHREFAGLSKAHYALAATQVFDEFYGMDPSVQDYGIVHILTNAIENVAHATKDGVFTHTFASMRTAIVKEFFCAMAMHLGPKNKTLSAHTISYAVTHYPEAFPSVAAIAPTEILHKTYKPQIAVLNMLMSLYDTPYEVDAAYANYIYMGAVNKQATQHIEPLCAIDQ